MAGSFLYFAPSIIFVTVKKRTRHCKNFQKIQRKMPRLPPVPQDTPEAKRSNLDKHRAFFRMALDTCSAFLVNITAEFAGFESLQVSDLTDTEVDFAEEDLYTANKDMERVCDMLKTASLKMQCLGPRKPEPEVATADETMELEVNEVTLQAAIDALARIRKRPRVVWRRSLD